MDIDILEARLAEAKANEAKATMTIGGPADEWSAAVAVLYEAERAVALAKGEEAALSCPWEIPWDIGAPTPIVLSKEGRTFLVYISGVIPNDFWDETSAVLLDPTRPDDLAFVLIEFIECNGVRFGSPNDEVIEGHPLYGKGLDSYAAHWVANSQWMADLKHINSVHPLYNPDSYSDLKHYLLLFHDDMFECLATGHRVISVGGDLNTVLQSALAGLRIMS